MDLTANMHVIHLPSPPSLSVFSSPAYIPPSALLPIAIKGGTHVKSTTSTTFSQAAASFSLGSRLPKRAWSMILA